jgi:hypothetical protein
MSAVSYSTILLSIIIYSLMLIVSHLGYAEAHFSMSNKRIQEWIDRNDKVRIQFLYEPEMPIIDEFTELKFSVQNASTSEHIKDLTGRVTVTNGQRLFIFQNISIPDGDFSVKYLFPDDGTHQVLLRVDGKESKLTEIASFKVFVPHQGPPSMLDPFMADKINATILVGAILAGVLITTVIFLMKRK